MSDTPYVTVSAVAYGLSIDLTISGEPQEGGREGFDHVADLLDIATAAVAHALPVSAEYEAELAQELEEARTDA